jgi:hypothetical protein
MAKCILFMPAGHSYASWVGTCLPWALRPEAIACEMCGLLASPTVHDDSPEVSPYV